MVKLKIFFFLGCVFLCIGVYNWYQSHQIVWYGECVTGYVFEMKKYPKKTRQVSVSEAPVVQFTTKKGETFRHFSNFYVSPPLYEPGDSVKIWYLPQDPNKATLNDATGSWLLLIPGLSCLLVSGLLMQPSVQKWFGLFQALE